MIFPEIEEQEEHNAYSLEDGLTLCRESYIGIEIEQCKRHEPCSMPLYHYHDSYEIYYLLSGTRHYFINDRTYKVEKGDLVLINRGNLHKTTYGGSPMHERILINFNEAYIQDTMRMSADVDLLQAFRQNINLVKLQKAEQTAVERMLFNIMKEAREKDLGHASYVRLALGELLIFITRKATHTKPTDSAQIDYMHGKVSEIQKYVNNRYKNTITLGSISEKFYISPFYLSRMFKKATGFTFTEYLNSLRIREAQQLLKESQLNVSEIADKVGYESQTHFGRVFKKITGMSPLQYRKLD
ncbi:MAG: AraC family transcriptional regulator [Chloroflexi bacterium HGW-Chloroflexi-10]|nr:MAG: AraC family transcriptional regulator [Chloroflexi bacterium HGW-Chloroflexi-10]